MVGRQVRNLQTLFQQTMINDIIRRYKRLRNRQLLGRTIEGEYAFVGVGHHSISNLYPALDYLHVPLKYICCRSCGKLALVERQWRGVHATTSLEEILSDESVKGVFVSVDPAAHFDMAQRIMGSGKALFIEKPPCRTLAELQQLIGMEMEKAAVTAVGMQKRFAPATRILANRLMRETVLTYNMRYVTGSYPEGDALTDLFIHPLDYACYLFGKAEVCCCQHVRGRNGTTCLLTLKHNNIRGVLELSTAYSWYDATEILTVNTEHGVYAVDRMETLTFTPKQSHLFGIPVEKVLCRNATTEVLFARNNFVPAVGNNQIYTQGFLNEIKAFVQTVQGGNRFGPPCGFASMYDTYNLMAAINQ